MAGPRMRIIVDDSREKIEAHASRTIKWLEEREFKQGGFPNPIGLPLHAVLYPNLCDDCGETFWANDQYAAHVKCPRRKRVGFQQ